MKLQITAEMFDDIPQDKRFQDTEYLIEATDNEASEIWSEWQYEQENPGMILQIGQLAKMPVTITMTWNILNGKRFAFYKDTSLVVDHALIEEWLNKYVRNKAGKRVPQTDAQNFHNAAMALFGDDTDKLRAHRRKCLERRVEFLENLRDSL